MTGKSFIFQVGLKRRLISSYSFHVTLLITVVTENELQVLAQSIRPFMERAIKIEVAPWIRDYVVDMEELYTELSLEKNTQQPARRRNNCTEGL